MHAQLQANAAIIKLVGIFEEKYSKKFIQRFTKIGYKEELFGDQTKSFLKNTQIYFLPSINYVYIYCVYKKNRSQSNW